jgi:hypothetical protein
MIGHALLATSRKRRWQSADKFCVRAEVSESLGVPLLLVERRDYTEARESKRGIRGRTARVPHPGVLREEFGR